MVAVINHDCSFPWLSVSIEPPEHTADVVKVAIRLLHAYVAHHSTMEAVERAVTEGISVDLPTQVPTERLDHRSHPVVLQPVMTANQDQTGAPRVQRTNDGVVAWCTGSTQARIHGSRCHACIDEPRRSLELVGNSCRDVAEQCGSRTQFPRWQRPGSLHEPQCG